ncbi:Coiled-coil domain-containing protein [Armadillidium nasatum]|uniref:Coiled-coil domain-containing protein 102A n=1 Tax=Armadillidium nasatum TaxID=96803 RepID=A0A5N5THW6_9CRUS|nr:Coiled-coil domain-containing protein [Armadillidium nasatum]
MAQQSNNGPSRKGTTVTTHSHSSPSHSHENVPLPYHWHDKQELMMRELEEARARATQMEKTMRWWSDCTANWREKWSKVRSERNKAREEVRLLRCRLEALQREAGVLRRKNNELESQMSQYENSSQKYHKKTESCLINKLGNGNEVSLNQDFESPERDNNGSKNTSSSISASQNNLSSNDKEVNVNLLEEMFGCQSIEDIAKSVENVSVYVHSADDSSKLNEKCRSNKETKLYNDGYLQEMAEKDTNQVGDLKSSKLLLRENDVEEKLSSKSKYIENTIEQKQAFDNTLIGNGSGNSSSQPSPSHRISAMSDPLPEACHISPRISAISDPLSEVCGTSECSETGYAESIRSSDGFVSRRWRGGCGLSAVSSSGLDDSGITPEQESLEQQVTMLKLRLEEATKTIQAEREEKNLLDRENSRWQTEVGELRARLEDVRASRQEAVKELVALRALHQKEVQTLQLEMLADLRGELERLQEENAAEWGKRERLESEKLGLERETKKLRSQISDLEERLDKRNKMSSHVTDIDVGNLKDELVEKSKELSELKHSHCKLKKVLSDKSTELQHCNRRADQYESEVKRLRSRVDELKKELAASEDEVDKASNNIRKLQRSNDELQETVENLQVQVEHMQSRLRSSAHSLPIRSSSLLRHDSDDEPAEFLT